MKIMIFLQILFVIFRYSQQLEFSEPKKMFIGSQQITFDKFHFVQNHILAIGRTPSLSKSAFILNGSNFDVSKLQIDASLYNQIKTAKYNNETELKKFLAFDENIVNLYFSASLFKNIMRTDPNILKIVSACFGSSLDEIFVLYLCSDNKYNVTKFENIDQSTPISTSITISSTNGNMAFHKMLFKKQKLFLMFWSVVVSVTFTPMPTQTKIKQLYISATDPISLTSDSTYIFFSFINEFLIVQIDTLNHYWGSNSLHHQNILHLSVSFPYLFVQTPNKLLQYDYSKNVKKMITFFTVNQFSTQKYVTKYYPAIGQIVAYKQNNSDMLYLFKYYTRYQADCENCGCFDGYQNTAGVCKRVDTAVEQEEEQQMLPEPITGIVPLDPEQLPQPILPVPQPQPQPQEQPQLQPQPQDELQQYPQSSTAEQTQEPQQPQPQPPSSQLPPTIMQLIPPQVLEGVRSTLGNTLTLVSLKITPSFLLAFTGFLDDLWMYRYHRNLYPKAFTFFTNQVSVVNQIRISPWFMQVWDLLQGKYVCIKQNQKFVEYIGFSNNQPQEVYFLHSAEDNYKNNLLMNILFMIILRTVLIVLIKISNYIDSRNQNNILQNTQKSHKKSFLKNAIKSIRISSRWWILLTSILEVNMLKLTYNCFLQMLLPSSFQFVDKINLVLTTVVLFGLAFYCICFYPLIYQMEREIYSGTLLTKSKFNFRSFYFQPLFFVCRNFIRSFVHSFLILNYPIQIVLLSLSDICFLIICLNFRQQFISKPLFFLSLMYSLVFVCLDGFFALNTLCPQLVGGKSRELGALIMLISLASISIAICLVMFWDSVSALVKDVLHSCKKKTKQQVSIKFNPPLNKNIILKKMKKNKDVKKVDFQNIQNQSDKKTSPGDLQHEKLKSNASHSQLKTKSTFKSFDEGEKNKLKFIQINSLRRSKDIILNEKKRLKIRQIASQLNHFQ